MECISLPEELVEQILYRVPIESVARWRSTSKQWNALLKSKRFLKTHSASAPRLRLFPVPTTRSVRMRKTYVVLDMSGYSNPEKFHPCSIKEQIEAAMRKEGYYGELSIWVYGAENTWSTELESIFWEAGIEAYQYKGDKRTRLHMLIADFLAVLFSMNYSSNFLILSENKQDMEQDPRFSRFRKALENNGFFLVSAHTDKLIIEDTKPVHSETA
uniref:Putative F-box protein n=2 Tax=Noccaea caerulescens TaxID=107243 RepID=A0A1J3EWE9_NOCCA